MTGTKDVSNVGFEVSRVDDGLDYGSDDDWDIKRMLTVYLRPGVDAPVVVASNATIDFDVGVRCAVADLCGLPFWWRHEGVLRIIFESMAQPAEYTEFDDVR